MIRRPGISNSSTAEDNSTFWVAIIGRVRSVDSLAKTLRNLENLYGQGKLEGAVWVADYPLPIEVRSRVENFSWLRIVSIPEVGDEFVAMFDSEFEKREVGVRAQTGGLRRGTMFRQFRSFRFALDSIPLNAIVLKTRADIFISMRALARLRALAGVVASASEKHPLGRIWVQWASARHPLYIQDTIFMGGWSRLDLLVTDDINKNLVEYYPTSPLPPLWWMNLLEPKSALWDYFRSSKIRYLSGELPKAVDSVALLEIWIQFMRENFFVRNLRGIKWHLQWRPEKAMSRIWVPVPTLFWPARWVMSPPGFVTQLFQNLGHVSPHIVERDREWHSLLRRLKGAYKRH